MKPEWIAAGAAALALLGQVLNYALNAKLRAEMAALKDSLLDRVDDVYKRKDVCTADMDAARSAKCPLALRRAV